MESPGFQVPGTPYLHHHGHHRWTFDSPAAVVPEVNISRGSGLALSSPLWNDPNNGRLQSHPRTPVTPQQLYHRSLGVYPSRWQHYDFPPPSTTPRMETLPQEEQVVPDIEESPHKGRYSTRQSSFRTPNRLQVPTRVYNLRSSVSRQTRGISSITGTPRTPRGSTSPQQLVPSITPTAQHRNSRDYQIAITQSNIHAEDSSPGSPNVRLARRRNCCSPLQTPNGFTGNPSQTSQNDSLSHTPQQERSAANLPTSARAITQRLRLNQTPSQTCHSETSRYDLFSGDDFFG